MNVNRLATGALLALLGSTAVRGQVADPADRRQPTSGPSLALGGSVTAVRRGCQTCGEELPARHIGSLVADAGYAVDRRTTIGAEVAWMPIRTPAGRRSTTHVDALVRFRPWSRRGFFVKGGAGLAFVRSALDEVDTNVAKGSTAKALSLVLGAGWTWRTHHHVAYQVFGAQHAAALGDLQTAGGTVDDVLTNFWSVGLGIALR